MTSCEGVFGDPLGAGVGVGGEGGLQDGLEVRVNLDAELAQGRPLVGELLGDDVVIITIEGELAAEHLKDDHGQGVYIAAAGDPLARHLLRRHVGDRSNHQARVR